MALYSQVFPFLDSANWSWLIVLSKITTMSKISLITMQYFWLSA
jgi:hypothetical protein